MKKSLAVLLALVLATSSFAQIGETIEVRVTNVDVVVTDGSGRPVTGLTKDDFELFEAGKPQVITNFYEVLDQPALTATLPAANAAAAPAAASTAAPPEVSRRRIVVFVDNYSLHPHARTAALQSLEKSLDKLMRRGDQIMMVIWNNGGRETITPLTADRAVIAQHFKEATQKSSGAFVQEATRKSILENAAHLLEEANRGRQGEVDRQNTLDTGRFTGAEAKKLTYQEAYNLITPTVRNFAEQTWSAQKKLLADVEKTIGILAGVEGKKVLIYLGAELPENPGLDLFQQVDSMFQQYIRNIQPAVAREPSRNLAAEMRKLAHHANALGVTMYMVDSSSRRSNEAGERNPVDSEASFAAESGTSMAMATVADITGGLHVAGGQTFDTALTTIANDLSSYYSLGYRAPSQGSPDRRIEVKVRKPGLKVRSRHSYTSRPNEEVVKERVIANILHGEVRSDFPITVAATAPEKQTDGRYKVTLKVTFPSSMTLIPQGDALTGEFAVSIVTGRADGALSTVTTEAKPMKFPKGSEAQIAAAKVFSYSAPLIVNEGEQIVSVAVTDKVAGTMGFARTTVSAR